MFRFYTNAMSAATRGVIIAVCMLGLMLIGFGVLIMAFPRLFATLAAIVFFIAGFAALSAAMRMYASYRRFRTTMNPPHDENYGTHPRIHELDDFEDRS
jgi:hypothetical protein